MPSRDLPELPEGLSLLDRYTVIDHIGGGGMATIYRAHDSRLDRVVCVKLLRNVLEASESSGMVYQATYTHFLQEARALSKLAHPNTLRIYDFGFLAVDPEGAGGQGPRPFHISEFLDAGNLETYVRARGTLRPVEVLAILDRVAGAIAEAHSMGILHRDIKPSNILFSRVGDVLMPKLADFGIARAIRRKARAGHPTDEGESPTPLPFFSPRWAAPEQLRSGEEGPSTDVYALALVAAYMLQGRGLFEMPDVTSTFDDRVQGDAFVHSRLALHPFAPEVARVFADALRADPAARTQSPFELYEALSHALGTPRASLPSPIAHSGVVPSLPAPRKPTESITVELTFDEPHGAQSVEPPERWVEVQERRVRIVETHERLDLSIPAATGAGVDVRFRVTLLPTREKLRVNVKGLSCFVQPEGGSLSPAVAADADGSAAFVSTQKEQLGRLAWSFGSLRGDARVFPVARGELVVPFPQGRQAVLLDLGTDREVIVICRRA